jgi:serine-type D-Ala-D-Ala carboxypeptidase/endopeptidase
MEFPLMEDTMKTRKRNTDRRIRIASFLPLVFLAPGMSLPSLSAATNPPTIPDDIKQSARQRVDNGYCPGIVVGIVTPRGRTYFGYGRTALPNGKLPDKDTIFEIGSITKVFTGLLLADMVERRELALDDAIDELLPQGTRAPARNGKRITLVDLATHTSGLPRVPDNMASYGIDDPYRDYGTEPMYAFLSRYRLPRDIGGKFEYSNYGMGLLGHLLAGKSGMTYESIVRRRICGPLGMPDTSITLTPAMKARLAGGHHGDTPVGNWSFAALAGAGALRSTANDLLTFLAANMGLQASPLHSAMDLSQTPRRPTDMDGIQVGLAWLILVDGKQTICWHNGGTGGYCSFIGFDKATKTAIVALANGAQEVDDIGFHFLLPAVPLSDHSTPARTAKPVAMALLPGEKLPKGEALFERAIQQLGGRAAMAKIRGRRMEAEVEMIVYRSRLKGSSIIYQVRPDRAYSKTDIPGVVFSEEGMNGAIAWEVDSQEGARVVAGREKEMSRLIDSFDPAVGKELYQTFTCAGKFQIEGQACYKVVGISRNYAIPVTWYFAADSGLPLGKEYLLEHGGEKTPVEERYGDFKPVDKILYPFEIRQLVQGVTIRIRINRIEHNGPIPSGRFDPPEAVKKLRKGETEKPGPSTKALQGCP